MSVGPDTVDRLEGHLFADFVARPLTENCRRVYCAAEHVVVGVSPGNSYFSVALLAGLFRWLSGRFRRVDVVVPDYALLDTYLALEYSVDRASKKASGEIRRVCNRIGRAWRTIGAGREGNELYLLSDLVTHPAYLALRHQVDDAMAQSQVFRDAVRAMSHDVLRHHRGGADPAPAQVDRAIRYLLAEIPMFLGSATIFQTPSSLNFYHRKIPLANPRLLAKAGLKVPEWQGYALISPAGAL